MSLEERLHQALYVVPGIGTEGRSGPEVRDESIPNVVYMVGTWCDRGYAPCRIGRLFACFQPLRVSAETDLGRSKGSSGAFDQ